jgi:EAL domain-containing protein (putative c-di-GMP-specific phosphodiesterase class I)
MQWADAPSARALPFALRRLAHEPVTVVAAKRSAAGPPAPSDLIASLATGVDRLTIGPITPVPLGRLVRQRLDRDFAPPLVQRIHEASGGNPFFALEIGWTLKGEDALLNPGSRYRCSRTSRDLLRRRLAALPRSARDALLLAASSAHPTVPLVEGVEGGSAGLAEAESAGIVQVHGTAIEFTHPLFASTVYEIASARDRRTAHAALKPNRGRADTPRMRRLASGERWQARFDLWFAGGGLSSPVMSRLGVLALLLAVCWIVSYAVGGAGIVPPHLFYIPILIAASWFSYRGALLAAVGAGLLAGPLLPLDTDAGTAQALIDWTSRAGFFLGLGQIMAWIVARRQGAEGALRRTEETVATLSERLAHQENEIARRREIARRIEGVLAGEGLHMVFQPIMNLGSGEPCGVEALARFETEPRRGPDVWFAEAADVGLAVDLELAAVRAAIAGLPQLPPSVYLSVNLSPATLVAPEFRQILRTVPPNRLVVEITEHAPVDEYEALVEPLAELRAHGGRLAVDDVGAGFASLRHILRLAPDVIKLDIGLTRHVDSEPAVHALATALIAFASELGISVISEGIETRQELEALRALGVTTGQGYYLGRPLPIDRLTFATDLGIQPHRARAS